MAFTTTHWSMVLEAQTESPTAQEALEKLCQIYWPPIYSFVQRKGVDPEEAKDITQDFFADLLEHRNLTAVRKEKGRFRSYLLGALKYFLADERRRAMAIKRGKGQRLIPLEELSADERTEMEPADSITADQIYDRRWAATLLERVLGLLKNEYVAAGNTTLFDCLKQLLPDEPGSPSQAEIAGQLGMLQQTVFSYDYLRRYREEEAVLDRALAIEPNDVETKATRAMVEFDWKADTLPFHQLIDELHKKNPGAIQSVAEDWLVCTLAERDSVAAANALAALGENGVDTGLVKYSPRIVKGLIARMTKNDALARVAFTDARAEQEKVVRAHPDDAGALCVLGLIDATLGRKQDALSEGRRAVELVPIEKDAMDGGRMIMWFARIAAWVGDNHLACEQLAIALRYPMAPSYGQLKLMPWWDPLRGDPCFERIVASLAPK